MKGIRVLWIVIITLFFNNISYAQSPISEKLKTIPTQDLEALKRALFELMNKDHLIYTLFDVKPISFSGHFTVAPLGNFLSGCNKDGLFCKNWETWEKYKSLFPINHYVFFEEISSENIKSIVLINKQLFIDTVQMHLETFKEYLCQDITPTGLLSEIEKKQSLFSTIKHNPLLLGILLGYGKHNAELFYQREKVRQFINNKYLPRVPYQIAKPSKPFSSLKEEYDFYHAKLKPFDDYHYSPLIVDPVHFVADHQNSETIKLKERYKKARGRISKIYSKADFLEVTLSKLMEL
ncbi:conserved hypothetical protein (plasmid) [Candidatus Protochlamydia naegleriophila]|uniref:Uncharacterized protein n=1 Tax=Candidatus Protochlamydia naegleriophila TaxID=389348 RepID=A0A0U5JGW4_9BACT|nr:hypothetical protein [Candidatus Protochlamydia naegleriophila]CUI18122.1 conserved hypothetical protein [Candidatus Protochlamydia naegleriophila]